MQCIKSIFSDHFIADHVDHATIQIQTLQTMLRPLYVLTSLQPPELSLVWPSWLGLPSSNMMFLVILTSDWSILVT